LLKHISHHVEPRDPVAGVGKFPSGGMVLLSSTATMTAYPSVSSLIAASSPLWARAFSTSTAVT